MRAVIATLAALLCSGCTDSGILEGKECDADGRCLPGYFCEPVSNRCLRHLPDADGGEDGDGEDGDGEDGVEIPAPIVLHRFHGEPSSEGDFDDLAPRAPRVDLVADPRQPLGLSYGDEEVDFQDGRLQAEDGQSQALCEALLAAGSFSAEVWADPAATIERGPARILTVSLGVASPGLCVAQDDNDLVAWVRTSATGLDVRANELRHQSFPSGRPRHVLLVYDGTAGLASLYVDGALQDTVEHLVGGAPAALELDPTTQRLGLGDDFVDSLPWRGTIQRMAFWDVALGPDQARALYDAGP